MSDLGPTSRYEPVAHDTRRQDDNDHLTIRIPKPGSGGPMRSALRTTEFWMTIGFALFVLLATYLDEDTLDRVDGWRFATFAVVAYVISRGLAKFGNHSDADHERRG
jgi:hypothetical protein